MRVRARRQEQAEHHEQSAGNAFESGTDAPQTFAEARRRRQTERNTSSQAMTPAIKMLIGDWHVDEVGIMTREITARD